jgi:ethanolamine permease
VGFLVTTLFVATMYTAFIFSFTELTTSIPRAGGPFAYAQRALGPTGAYLAGAATLIEFVFAPPAIALAMHISMCSFLRYLRDRLPCWLTWFSCC